MTTTRVLIYARVSTDQQERDGASLASQKDSCLRFALDRQLQVIDCVSDTASGFTLDRPGLDRVREAVRVGDVDMVLAHALDRLSRKQTHVGILVEEFEQAGVRLELATETFEQTATGQLLRSVTAFAAEFERERIMERTLRGKAHKAREGHLVQGTGLGIYGYDYLPDLKRREINPSQAAVVTRIFESYAATQSFSMVAGGLNDEGIPAFAGGRWYPLTVRRILINETYTGKTTYRRTRREKAKPSVGGPKTVVVARPEGDWIDVPGATPAIIDDLLWRRVQAILVDPNRIKRRPQSRGYLLSGRVRCGRCHSAMVGQTLTGGGRSYRYYRCRHAYDKNSGSECDARYIRADILEGAVWGEVMRVLLQPEMVVAELGRGDDRPALEAERTRLKKRLADSRQRQQRLVRLFASAAMDEAIVSEESARLRRDADELQRQLSGVEARLRSRPEFDAQFAVDACYHLRDQLAETGDDVRGTVLDAMQVRVFADRDLVRVEGVLPGLTAPLIFATSSLVRDAAEPSDR